MRETMPGTTNSPYFKTNTKQVTKRLKELGGHTPESGWA